MNTYFITGISTDVGKTIAAAIVVEALQADYWKPIQAGDLDNSDTAKVKSLVSNDISQYHDSSYALKTPMSPHAAAQKDNTHISLSDIVRPTTKRILVIEGAGGLLVPLNNVDTIIDLIDTKDKVIIVSRHYLGSINHTLLTVEALKNRGLHPVGILFSGNQHPTTETSIAQMTQVPIIGRIDEEPYFDRPVITAYADRFRKNLLEL